MQAESCYHLAEGYHAEWNYEEAFRYYYQPTHLALKTFTSDCFEKILKIHSNDHELMNILANIYAESNDPDKRDKGKDSLKKVKQHNAQDIDSWIQLAEILEDVDL
ncbi:unnamed protein product [Rotaria sp. Silwood1]|nr:unnamed protein product [Rotaria sp. Silwood1]